MQSNLEKFMLSLNDIDGATFLGLDELDKMKPGISIMYNLSYLNSTKHEFFENLESNLQDKILNLLIEQEMMLFSQLFFDNDIDDQSQIVNQKIINRIFSALDCEIHEASSMVVKPDDFFSSFYLIKSGEIATYDLNYNYMYNLQQGSFFGDYNIVFTLYSNMFYKAVPNLQGYIVLYKIDSETLLNCFCTDIVSFKHLFNISLQKFRNDTNT